MISQNQLTALQVRLQELIVEDTDATLAALKEALPPQSPRFKDVLNIEGKYKSAKQDKIREVDSADNLRVVFNRVREDLIDLIALLEVADFDPNKITEPISKPTPLAHHEPATNTIRKRKSILFFSLILLLLVIAYGLFHYLKETPKPETNKPDDSALAAPLTIPADQEGHLLYKIPKEMQLEQWSTCVVRLSFDEVSLKRDIDIAGAEIKKLNSISEVMEVNLIDPDPEVSAESTVNFNIKTINREQQRITTDNYTEWTFSVKPLKVGTFPLALKVSIIEDGVPREIVFNDTIQVITTTPRIDGSTMGYQNTGFVLSAKANDSNLPDESEKMQFQFSNFNYSVGFKYNSTEIVPGIYFSAYLDSLVTYTHYSAQKSILLIGHADNLGTAEYNMMLGKKRAAKIKGILIEKGIRPERIKIESRGETEPVANNETAEGRRRNRRVVIRIQ